MGLSIGRLAFGYVACFGTKRCHRGDLHDWHGTYEAEQKTED
jgi:hypothetical protein